MKRSICILALILLTGCGSYRYEYFKNSFSMPTQELQAGYKIEPSCSTFHIPFIICRSFRGEPYFLNINFFSENLPEERISLTKVLFTNTMGKRFNLLNAPMEMETFEQERFAASSSKYGRYDNLIYKAQWKSEKLTLKFQNGKSCEIEIEYAVGEKRFSKKWRAGTNLQKKTTNIISFYKSI